MPSKYPKRSLQLLYWCVSRKDLYMIFGFFRERFGTDKVTVLLETKGGRNNAYADFEELSRDIEVVLSLNDEVQRIIILYGGSEPHGRRYIWITIAFAMGVANFSIFAADEDRHLQDWVENTYKEMEKLFALFRPGPDFIEILKRDFLPVYPERRRSPDHGVVVFDYDGNIQDRIHRELAAPPAEPSAAPAMPRGAWWKDARIIAGLAGSLALLALLLLSFLMK